MSSSDSYDTYVSTIARPKCKSEPSFYEPKKSAAQNFVVEYGAKITHPQIKINSKVLAKENEMTFFISAFKWIDRDYNVIKSKDKVYVHRHILYFSSTLFSTIYILL